MKTPSGHHSVRHLVESLSPGTRVVWIANSTGGTVQPDKTILWDDGSHMTHQQMRSSHALLIHSEAEVPAMRLHPATLGQQQLQGRPPGKTLPARRPRGSGAVAAAYASPLDAFGPRRYLHSAATNRAWLNAGYVPMQAGYLPMQKVS